MLMVNREQIEVENNAIRWFYQYQLEPSIIVDISPNSFCDETNSNSELSRTSVAKEKNCESEFAR